MRQYKVDRVRVLELLSSGATNASIAREQGCSDQNISLLKQKFIRAGKLPADAFGKKTMIDTMPKEHPAPEISLDQAIETLLTAFERAKDYPMLKAELEKYKRGYENIMEAARAKDEADKKRKDQGQRFKVAQQQGDFTEHILVNTCDFIFERAPWFNIN